MKSYVHFQAFLILGAMIGWGATRLSAADADATATAATEQHKLVAKLEEGTWDAKVKAYLSGPSAAPEESTAVETVTVVNDGLWLATSFEGKFGGQKFTGRGLLGYDTAKKKYVAAWTDNMSSQLLTGEGTYDEKSKTATFLFDRRDESGKTVQDKHVTVYPADGKRNYTIYSKIPGAGDEPIKVMEIEYTRRK